MLWSNQPIRAIVVEDDPNLRLGLADFLRLNSLSVTAVGSGAEFNRAFGTETFDIAIIDVNLPDVSGFEIARYITKITGIAVIMLTARAMRDDKLRGYAEGANLYLTKPVDCDELILAIRNLVHRTRQTGEMSKQSSQPSKSWIVDRIAQQLISPLGAIIKLSGREAKLILRLAEDNGRTVSRKDLSIALGYNNADIETRSLDAVLRRLRSKVRDTEDELPIHVVHSMGFHFSAEIKIR